MNNNAKGKLTMQAANIDLVDLNGIHLNIEFKKEWF